MELHVGPNIWCDEIKFSVRIALKYDTSLSYSGVPGLEFVPKN